MKLSRALPLLLALVWAVPALGAAKRKVVPVPAWTEFDGVRWGELALGQTSRAAFERDYSSRATPLPGVLQGNTSGRTDTELLLLFDGPGPDARLAWIACFFDGSRGAPTPLEFEGRYGAQAVGGYLPERRADWRLRAAAERGVAAVVERGGERERVAALLYSRPERIAALGRRLSAEPTEILALLEPEDREPLVARVGYVDVDVDVDRDVNVDRRDLRRELERAAEDEARRHAFLRSGSRGGGRVAVSVDVEPRRRREEPQIRITARATLDAEGPYGIVSARSYDATRDLDAASSESRIEREARRLVEQVIASVAGTAQNQLQERRSKALSAARREARLSVVGSLPIEDR